MAIISNGLYCNKTLFQLCKGYQFLMTSYRKKGDFLSILSLFSFTKDRYFTNNAVILKKKQLGKLSFLEI